MNAQRSNRHQRRTQLRFHPRCKTAFYRLPFVGCRKEPALTRFWTVPATGGFAGGMMTGQALGQLFLRYLRDNTDELIGPLAWTVEAMMARWTLTDGLVQKNRPLSQRSPEFMSLSGQILGFFCTLESWLRSETQHEALPMSRLDEQELLDRANAGLAFDVEQFLKEHQSNDPE